MKKVISMLVAMMLVFSLVACGGNEEGASKKSEGENKTAASTESSQSTEESNLKLVIGEKYHIENYAEFELVKIHTTDMIAPSVGGYVGYRNSAENETYVDAIFDLTYKGDKSISTDKIMVAYAENNSGTVFEQNSNFVESGDEVDAYKAITPLSKIKLHCTVSVPKDETNVKLYFEVNDEKYTYDYTVNDTHSNAIEIKTGDGIKEEDFAELTFNGIVYTDDLLPSNTSGYYSHYQVDDPSNTYLVVKFDITNLQTTAKECGDFVGVKAKYLDKYEYAGNVVVEDGDGKGFGSHYESLNPLAKRKLFYKIEVPDSVVTNEVELTISFGGKEYKYIGK